MASRPMAPGEQRPELPHLPGLLLVLRYTHSGSYDRGLLVRTPW